MSIKDKVVEVHELRQAAQEAPIGVLRDWLQAWPENGSSHNEMRWNIVADEINRRRKAIRLAAR